jgi:DNA-binding CsgD family transcriptional regulator/PAS domain-containing protein
MGTVSREQLSRLIGDVYDCALEPERWQDAVHGIGEFMQCPTVALAITDLATRTLSRLYDSGWHPDFFKSYERLGHLNPVFFEARMRPVGDVIALCDVVKDEDFVQSRFYRECLQPFRQRDGIGVLGLRSGKRIAFIATTRTDDCPRFAGADIDRLRLLAPHISRTLKISDALEMSTVRSSMLEATLDQLNAGVVLLGRDGRIVHMNCAAERHIRAGTAVRICGNRLAPVDKQAAADFTAVVSGTRRPGCDLPPSNASIALPETEGDGLIANVLSLEQGHRQDVTAPFAASAAVFLQNVRSSGAIPGVAFAKLYGLTAGELRVVMALAPGLGVREASEMLGISEATVKSHLQRVFSKTDTSRQAELIQLLRSAAPVCT